MSYIELTTAAFFYQFCLYAAIRLAHRGFTLGELGLVCFGATVLFIEWMNLTFARVRLILLQRALCH
jgi:dolichol kinase